MPAYIVANVSIEDAAKYEEYKKAAPPSIAKHGGRYIARAGRSEALEGAMPRQRLVLLEFPSYEAAKQWWDSTEYADAKALRQSCARSDIILIEGTPPGFTP